jgi:hypothetical protein
MEGAWSIAGDWTGFAAREYSVCLLDAQQQNITDRFVL